MSTIKDTERMIKEREKQKEERQNNIEDSPRSNMNRPYSKFLSSETKDNNILYGCIQVHIE